MPTEAKWEYETRGGLAGKGYPWGDSVDSNKAYYDGCVEEPRAVGIYAAKGYGLYGMRGMYMNGGRIGMTKTTTATYQLRTHQDRAPTHPGCCEVDLGITRLMTCAWLPASTAVQLISTATTGFDVRQDRIKK